MNRKALLSILFVIALIAVTANIAPSTDGDGNVSVLIDKGNGQTYWTENDGGTLDEVFSAACSEFGMTFSSEGGISVDGVRSVTIGGTECRWTYYVYDSKWTETTYVGTAVASGTPIAIGYYPSGYGPTVTPEYRNAWTMIHGDALNSGSMTNYGPTTEETTQQFALSGTSPSPACYASPLYANGHLYLLSSDYGTSPSYCHMLSLDCSDGSTDWDLTYVNSGYALATGCIYGGVAYYSASTGTIRGIAIDGDHAGEMIYTYSQPNVQRIPGGDSYSVVMFGASSIVYDSGHLFVAFTSGKVACLTPELEEVWVCDVGTAVYPSLSVSVANGFVYLGGCNGTLYVLDESDGSIAASVLIYTGYKDDAGQTVAGGRVNVPAVIGSRIFVSYNDGTGMNCDDWGIAVLDFNSGTKTLTLVKDISDLEIQSSYLVISPNGFVFGASDENLYRIFSDGEYSKAFEVTETHGGFTLMNNTYLYATEYDALGGLVVYNVSGEKVAYYAKPSEIRNYSMGSTMIAGNFLAMTSDSGAVFLQGVLVDGNDLPDPTVGPPAVEKKHGSDSGILPYVVIAVVIIALMCALLFVAYRRKPDNVTLGAYLRNILKGAPTDSKIKQKKKRLALVCVLGFIATLAMFLCSLSIGPTVTLSIPDAFSALVSAVHKHGHDLTFEEIVVYQTRLPRAIAAVAVGIGLSVAGCAYQAIIRNPLVDPYIMGVSSGAGTFAVAAIAANFTFFGLLSNNNFATPILAIVGGLLAFGLTLLIAEKAGGSSTNYVLAGVVVGLVFSAAQTLILVTSDSDKLNSAISWLFGSFANVGWDTVWLIFFPAVFLALVPLFWAKELNLVLLGEDQARQMGLDVRKFNRWMLILASVLTSVCVAFVGIIGFVGMVIPHLSRMLLGGDHRLVLPASIMMGGALMLLADLLAKMLMSPTELPVGAITTIIGVPVFAYLLIKKGRMYDG